jgi:2-polyprenyl-6-hydroxyphenyl methylase / 3-demethylubiquinone-9 3-methyltransferase
MERIAPEIYSQINNHVYNEKGDLWWNPENILHILKTSVNPWRVGVAMDALNAEF